MLFAKLGFVCLYFPGCCRRCVCHLFANARWQGCRMQSHAKVVFYFAASFIIGFCVILYSAALTSICAGVCFHFFASHEFPTAWSACRIFSDTFVPIRICHRLLRYSCHLFFSNLFSLSDVFRLLQTYFDFFDS